MSVDEDSAVETSNNCVVNLFADFPYDISQYKLLPKEYTGIGLHPDANYLCLLETMVESYIMNWDDFPGRNARIFGFESPLDEKRRGVKLIVSPVKINYFLVSDTETRLLTQKRGIVQKSEIKKVHFLFERTYLEYEDVLGYYDFAVSNGFTEFTKAKGSHWAIQPLALDKNTDFVLYMKPGSGGSLQRLGVLGSRLVSHRRANQTRQRSLHGLSRRVSELFLLHLEQHSALLCGVSLHNFRARGSKDKKAYQLRKIASLFEL